MHACIHTYIHTNIHTYIHTYIYADRLALERGRTAREATEVCCKLIEQTNSRARTKVVLVKVVS